MLILQNAIHLLIWDMTSEETGVEQLPMLLIYDWSKMNHVSHLQFNSVLG